MKVLIHVLYQFHVLHFAPAPITMCYAQIAINRNLNRKQTDLEAIYKGSSQGEWKSINSLKFVWY